jgi:hypothetical protein
MSIESYNFSGSLYFCQFSLKFLAIFYDEFATIVSSGGRCPLNLFNAMSDIASQMSSNTQAIEGANNIVKSVGRVAPHISWDLMASRVTVKKAVEHLLFRAFVRYGQGRVPLSF